MAELKEDRNGALHNEKGHFVGTGNPGGIYQRRRETEQQSSEALNKVSPQERWESLWEKEWEKAEKGNERSIDRLLLYGQARASEHVDLEVGTRPTIRLSFPAIIDPLALNAPSESENGESDDTA